MPNKLDTSYIEKRHLCSFKRFMSTIRIGIVRGLCYVASYPHTVVDSVEMPSDFRKVNIDLDIQVSIAG